MNCCERDGTVPNGTAGEHGILDRSSAFGRNGYGLRTAGYRARGLRPCAGHCKIFL